MTLLCHPRSESKTLAFYNSQPKVTLMLWAIYLSQNSDNELFDVTHFFTQWDILDLHVIARGTWHLQSLTINICILPELKAQLDTFLSAVRCTVHLFSHTHSCQTEMSWDSWSKSKFIFFGDKANSTHLGFISFFFFFTIIFKRQSLWFYTHKKCFCNLNFNLKFNLDLRSEIVIILRPPPLWHYAI